MAWRSLLRRNKLLDVVQFTLVRDIPLMGDRRQDVDIAILGAGDMAAKEVKEGGDEVSVRALKHHAERLVRLDGDESRDLGEIALVNIGEVTEGMDMESLPSILRIIHA